MPVQVCTSPTRAWQNPGTPLESPKAGFPHAMTQPRSPIRIKRMSEPAPELDAAIAYWNKRAGWEMLIYSDEPDGHEILFEVGNEETFWATYWSSEAPYQSATITLPTRNAPNRIEWSWIVFAHEIGHCLGLAHRRKGVMGTWYRLTGPRTDRKILQRVGYR